jgi:hypothetical protein
MIESAHGAHNLPLRGRKVKNRLTEALCGYLTVSLLDLDADGATAKLFGGN